MEDQKNQEAGVTPEVSAEEIQGTVDKVIKGEGGESRKVTAFAVFAVHETENGDEYLAASFRGMFGPDIYQAMGDRIQDAAKDSLGLYLQKMFSGE